MSQAEKHANGIQISLCLTPTQKDTHYIESSIIYLFIHYLRSNMTIKGMVKLTKENIRGWC